MNNLKYIIAIVFILIIVRLGMALDTNKTNLIFKSNNKLLKKNIFFSDQTITNGDEKLIPVVFHIFDPVNPRKVTKAQINDAMRILNEDFNAENADLSNVSSLFSSVVGDVEVRFQLADFDPEGNPTDGILYYKTYVNGDTEVEMKKPNGWPANKYLNIYIVNEVHAGDFDASGVASLPSTSRVDSGTDGVTYNHKFLGTLGFEPGSSANGPEGFDRILTHEVGHWFGLRHTFLGGCDGDGDGIDDTPSTINGNLNCNLSEERCPGAGPANRQNFMGYSYCMSMFTNGQKTAIQNTLNSTKGYRNELWTENNLNSTVIRTSNPIARFIFSQKKFYETNDNDGAIETSSNLRSIDGASFSTTGVLTEGTHYTTENVPQGLQLKIEVLNANEAKVSFSGKASSHVDVVKNINFKLLGNAIQGGSNAIHTTYYTNLQIHYSAPFNKQYVRGTLVVDENENDKSFHFTELAGSNFQIVYDENTATMYFQSFTNQLIISGNSNNLIGLEPGTSIGPNSNWDTTEATTINDANVISGPNYNNLKGKTSYIGFRVLNGGVYKYGWLLIKVKEDGKRIRIVSMVFNDAPGTAILAGEGIGTPIATWTETIFKENSDNNGVIGEATDLHLLDKSFFTSSGTLTRNVHYTISNLPTGITPEFIIKNNTHATLNLIGTKSSHDAETVSNVNVQLLDAAFGDGSASNLQENELKSSIVYIDPYKISYGETKDDEKFIFSKEPVEASINKKFNSFSMKQAYDTDIALVYEDDTSIELNAFTDEIAVNAGTENITLLNFGTDINVNVGSWKTSRSKIWTNSFSTWAGKEGYVAFRVKRFGIYHYGWMRVTLSQNRDKLVIIDYAINENRNQSIQAGHLDEPILDPVGNILVRESLANDGTIDNAFSNPILFELKGSKTKVQNKTLSLGTDYSVSNLPSGLTTRVVVNNFNTISVYIEEKAISHLDSDESNVEIKLLNNTLQVEGENGVSSNIKIEFREPYGIIHTDIEDMILKTQEAVTPFKDLTLASHEIGANTFLESGNSFVYHRGSGRMLKNNLGKINLFTEGTTIDASGDYLKGFIYAIGQNDWTSNTGYLGVEFPKNGEIFYGWIRATLSADKSIITLHEFAYNNKPNEPIDAGDKGNIDTELPSIPNNLTAGTPTQTEVSLNWSASTDNVGVTGYDVYQGSINIGSTTTSTSYNVTGLSANTTYNFSVRAKDAAENVSSASNSVSVTTETASTGGGNTLPTYCEAKSTVNFSTYHISNVSLGGINNTSIYDNTSAPGYVDNTNLSTSVIKGATYDLSATATRNWGDLNVYIDWNRDGDFTDEGERVLNTGNASVTATVTVPSTAISGSTIMRVRLSLYPVGTTGPCGDAAYGEVEDYRINIENNAIAQTLRVNEKRIIEKQEETFSNDVIVVYPNPTKEFININSGNKVITNITITNSIGQIIYKGKDLKIDLSTTPSGFYFLTIKEENNIHQHQIIVKQ